MKKILFYTANGVGLGHLQRAHLIAEELKQQNKNIKIILATFASSPYIFGKFFDHLVKLTPLSDELLKDSAKTYAIRLSNDRKFVKALEEFKPDLIIADFCLTSFFSFYTFSFDIKRFAAKSIFIWRLEDIDSLRRDLKREADKLSYFQKIILPHDRRELKDLLPFRLFHQLDSNPKFEICGPIFRKPDKEKVVFCRQKYNIFPGDFLITVTVGSGGNFKRGRCESPSKIIKSFLAIYPRLSRAIPSLKAVIVTGPYFKNYKNLIPAGPIIVKFENLLPELMTLSQLIISAAGYNTSNEIIQAKIPAILIPLMRGGREQFERALYLEKKGVAKCLWDISPARLFNLTLECKKNLEKMKRNFKKFQNLKPGNKKAAELIRRLIK